MRSNGKLTVVLILLVGGAAVWSSSGAVAEVAPSGRLCFAVDGSPGDAAIVNLTPLQAQGAGNGQLISSDIAKPPQASNVNFGIGTVDPNVAVAKIGADGKVCYSNSKQANVHLVADHLGTIAAHSYTPATASGAPDRRVDTRIGQGGSRVAPSGRLCFAVAGSAGDAAIVNLTPVEAEGAGNGQLVASDVVTPPVASNVNFGQGTIDPNVAVVKIGADGEVCYVNSRHAGVHLVADHLGTIAAASYTPATASGAPDRKVDTRIGKGGPIVAPLGRLCFPVSGSPGDAAIVNLTPLLAQLAGNGQLISSDVATPPVASNANFVPGSVDPNVAVAKIGADGEVCYVNSRHTNVHLVADHLGTIKGSAYSPATASGAPARKVDTRYPRGPHNVPPGPSGGVSIDTVGGGFPSGIEIVLYCGRSSYFPEYDVSLSIFSSDHMDYELKGRTYTGNMSTFVVSTTDYENNVKGPDSMGGYGNGTIGRTGEVLMFAIEDYSGIHPLGFDHLIKSVRAEGNVKTNRGTGYVAEEVDVSNFPTCSSLIPQGGDAQYKELWKDGVLVAVEDPRN